MHLSPLIRNLISRGTALAVAFALAMACRYFAHGVSAIHREQAAQPIQVRSGHDTGGAGLFALFAFATGAGALLFGAFALLPTRILYAIDPSPSTSDGADVAAMVLESLKP
jgi:hypothetical protein